MVSPKPGSILGLPCYFMGFVHFSSKTQDSFLRFYVKHPGLWYNWPVRYLADCCPCPLPSFNITIQYGTTIYMYFVIILYIKSTIFIRRCLQDPTLIPYSTKTRPLSNWSARVSIVIGCSLLTISCMHWTSSEHTGIGET